MTSANSMPEGWYPDPSGRHEYRFWNGTGWTPVVSDHGVVVNEAAAQSWDAAPRSAPPRSAAPVAQPVAPLAAGAAPYAGAQQYVGYPGAPGSPGAPTPRGSRRWLMPIVAVVVVLGLVAGLVIWAPWVNRTPGTPTAVSAASSDASSIVVKWEPGTEGPAADQYLVMRDGVQVGSVAGSERSFTDSDGLSPAESYDYTVVAVSGDRRSQASTAQTVQTIAPSPTEVQSDGSTTSSVLITWSAPEDAPEPDKYRILRDGEEIGTVSGSETSFKEKGLAPATKYKYQVAAVWGDRDSEPSGSVKVATLRPPLSAARVTGTWDALLKSAGGNGTWPKAGKKWHSPTAWKFRPTCKSGACTVVATVEVNPPQFKAHPVKVKLTKHGSTYSGSTKAHVTVCGSKSKPVNNTVVVRLKVKKAGVQQGIWVAETAVGSVQIKSPYTSVGGGWYCPANTDRATVTATPY